MVEVGHVAWVEDYDVLIDLYVLGRKLPETYPPSRNTFDRTELHSSSSDLDHQN